MINAVRDGNVIIKDLHILTARMVEQRHATDFLTDSVEQRQLLIDEYQHWADEYPKDRATYEKTAEAKRMVKKILEMDQVISKTLSELKTVVQQSVQSSSAQQKVIGYLGGSASASGSYMDFKK